MGILPRGVSFVDDSPAGKRRVARAVRDLGICKHLAEHAVGFLALLHQHGDQATDELIHEHVCDMACSACPNKGHSGLCGVKECYFGLPEPIHLDEVLIYPKPWTLKKAEKHRGEGNWERVPSSSGFAWKKL